MSTPIVAADRRFGDRCVRVDGSEEWGLVVAETEAPVVALPYRPPPKFALAAMGALVPWFAQTLGDRLR